VSLHRPEMAWKPGGGSATLPFRSASAAAVAYRLLQTPDEESSSISTQGDNTRNLVV